MAIPHPERDAIDSILRSLCLATGQFLSRGTRYYIDGKEVFLLGVSCRQIGGTQRELVAVFGTERPEKVVPLTDEELNTPVAVLVRPTAPDEQGYPKVAVILLRIINHGSCTIIFDATHITRYYNPI